MLNNHFTQADRYITYQVGIRNVKFLAEEFCKVCWLADMVILKPFTRFKSYKKFSHGQSG